MSGPFIFIGTHRIADGQLEAFKNDARALVQLVRDREPQLVSFNFFFNEDETEVSVVQVHPDADSMLTHMQVAQEHITEATGNTAEYQEHSGLRRDERSHRRDDLPVDSSRCTDHREVCPPRRIHPRACRLTRVVRPLVHVRLHAPSSARRRRRAAGRSPPAQVPKQRRARVPVVGSPHLAAADDPTRLTRTGQGHGLG